MLKRRTPAADTAATTTPAPAGKFEAPDDDNTVDNSAAIAAAKANAARLAAAAAQHAAENPAEATTTPAPVAPAKTTALTAGGAGQVVALKPMIDPLSALKEAFVVQFNTLRNLIITNGNVMDRESNKPLGDEIGFELMSYQPQWTISPGVDGDEGKECVRYSDDGVTTSQGEDCREYVKRLKEGDFPKAKMEERCVIVGSLFDAGKMPELQDKMVQISLSPTSKANFDRYRLDQANQIRRGLVQPEGSQYIAITCELVTANKLTWTKANFERAETE